MGRWSLAETREHVKRRYGEAQLELVRNPLKSIVERLHYARYDFQEHQRLLSINIDAKLSATSIYEISLSVIQPESPLLCVGANIVACLQSVHALGDILAHVVYFATGMNLGPQAMEEKRVALSSVRERLNATYPELAATLKDIQQHADFKYLSAFVNHSKHRSVIDNVLFVDTPAQGRAPYSLLFDNFTYLTENYGRREITPYLEGTYAWLVQRIDDCGVELNKVISKP